MGDVNRRLARRDRERARNAQAHQRIEKTCALCGQDRPVRKMIYSNANDRQRASLAAVCDACVDEGDE